MENESIGIEIKNISKTYAMGDGDLDVLDKISIHAQAGTFTSIVGPSGCGKSTLLKIIALLEKPSSGCVEFNGKAAEKPSLDVGVLFQESRLLPWFDVEKNVDFGLPGSVEKEERRKRVQEYIDLVGLSGFEHALPEQLSGGMKKRVSIARTLINRPHVLLLDEPFGTLDAFTKILLQNELQNICGRMKVTTILVTHDIEESVFLGDQVVVMTQKPTTVKKVIPVELPKKRDRTSEDFFRYKKMVFEEFFQMNDTNIGDYT